jgi:hypothetical protein
MCVNKSEPACRKLLLWQKEKVKENMSGLSAVSAKAGIIARV